MWHCTTLMQSQNGSPSQDDVTFPSTLLAIPHSHRGKLFLMEVEGLWPPTSWSNEMSLLDAMSAECLDISAEDCQGWIRHAKQLFCPRWHTMWFGWESVTKCSTIDYDFYQCIYKFLHFGITYKNENILKHTASCLIHYCNIYLAVNSSPK